MAFKKKYPLDSRRYYDEYNHIPQKIFLKKLHKDKDVHKKISKSIKEKQKKGIWINPMLGKHHSKKVKQQHSIRMKKKYASGKLIPHNKGKLAENYEPLKRMGEKVRGQLNCTKRLSIRKKISVAAKRRFWNNPESHPNRNMNNISNPQKQLFFILNKDYKDAKLNYPLKCIGLKRQKSVKYLDVAIPSLKIDYEYDEPRWHDKEKDTIRDKILVKMGWVVIRISPNQLKTLRIEKQISRGEIIKAGVKYVI